ncbi:class IIb bacteriocin, lactobin A/cerein 7B family [Carboxylicivirga taeanensis]|uniref:class IIb bacteriocin, lactobin A/cerein 7B family n=1 Tax=Carboxylicivirga taeanensis TaxID=1416875 RepID=UPI003F6E3168
MNTLDLNIKELSQDELTSYNGGEILTALAIGIAVGAIAAIFANRRDKRRAEQ